MVSKKQLENFLRANGIEPNADDGTVKSVLLAARWNLDDIDAAITVLRENPSTQQQHVETTSHQLSTGKKLSPETISSLLGISVDIEPADIFMEQRKVPRVTMPVLTFMFAAGLISAIALLALILYAMEIGPFHTSAGPLF